jgi:hypothetical protein
MPGLDLGTIAQSAIAASIFFAWNIANSLSDPYPDDTSALSIAVDQAQFVAYLLSMSFGYVLTAPGRAGFPSPRAQPTPVPSTTRCWAGS